MPTFIGQQTKDTGPHCKGHPTQPIAFPGDRCYKCKNHDASNPIAGIRVNWRSVQYIIYVIVFVALFLMAFSSAFATWCQINISGGIK